MEKRKRNAGEGLLRQRKDGRWEGRIVIGYDDKNLPITKNVTSKSKTECERKLRELRDSLSEDIVKSSDDVTFGEWIDKWYRDYVKPFVKPKTQIDYENHIYKHIIPEIGAMILSKSCRG